MLALLAVIAAGAPPADTNRTDLAAATPAIQLSLNNDGNFAPGSRVTVRVQASDDGYLVVFRVDGDGRVRVLFPLDPGDDAFIRGGKEYELRGRGDHETFLADDRSGNGVIYGAIAPQPLQLDAFIANGHWDYDAVALHDSSSDAENDLTALVSRMTGQQRFEYDAIGYRVQELGTVAVTGGDGYYPGFYDPAYDPRWRCLGCGWGYPGSDVSIGLNFGYSPFWDPYLFSPWGYNYGYNYGNGYGRGNYWFPGTYPVIIDRHPGVRVPPGTRSRPRPGGYAPAPGGNARAPREAPDRSRGDRRPEAPTVRTPSARPDAGAGVGTRARPRPSDMNVPVRTARPAGDRPTFRQPPQSSRPPFEQSRPEPQRQQPVYREPPRVERAPSSPPPRVERSSPPSQRSSPPSQRSSPPPQRSRPSPHHP